MDARIAALNTHTFSAPSPLASEAISVLSLSPMSGALSWWKPYDRNLARHLRDQMSAGLDRFRAEAQRYWQCTKRHSTGRATLSERALGPSPAGTPGFSGSSPMHVTRPP